MTGKSAKDCWLEEQAPSAIYARTILEAHVATGGIYII
jgi:hypothetical protein